MEFRLLGPIEVRRSGDRRPLALGGPRQRAVFAALAVRANDVVGVGYLGEAAWQRPPASLPANVRTYVTNLRRLLTEPGEDGSRLVGEAGGYRLAVRPGELDVEVFEGLADRAAREQRDGDDEAAVRLAEEALAVWRGRPLAGVELGPGLASAVARLDERWFEVVERRIECRLRLGADGEVVAELRALVAEHPLRESLAEHLMMALYRSGRPAEALDVYRRVRRRVVAELGIEPGPRLRGAQRAVLAGEPVRPPDQRPAPRTAATPAELPPAPSAFTGRDAELDRLEKLLDEAGGRSLVAVVAGMAGVGKTALAVHWARSVADRFPDGQIYLDLRGYRPGRPSAPGEALGHALRSLGVPPERIPAGPAEQATLYRSSTAGRRLLLLLDNARTADQVRPLLPGGDGCLALVTSRDALVGLAALDGAQPVRLEPLTPQGSRTLLGRLVDRRRVRAEPAALAELAALCAHLPLALRLAAARLSTQPGHPVRALVERLGRDALSTLEPPDDPAAAVRAAFDHSYLILDEPGRRLFRRLALAPGPDVCAHAAAALLDEPTPAVRPLLDTLVSAHLLDEPAAGRFRQHDLLRQYAAELAAADGPAERDAALRRVLAWYLRTAARATEVLDPHRRRPVPLEVPGPDRWPLPLDDHAAALDWCEAERPNLVAAVSAAAEAGLPELAWRLPVALFGFFDLRKHWAEWIDTHETGLAAARATGARHAEASMLNGLGIADKQQGHFDRAIERYGEVLAIRREIGDRHGEGVTLNNLGTATNRAGDTAAAIEFFRRAQAVFRETGDRWGEGLALTNMGEAYRRLGALEPALARTEEALAIRRALGDRRGEGIVLNNIANTVRALGRGAEALRFYREALHIRHSVGDRWGVARTLANLGTALHETGDRAGARRCWRRALAVFEELGDAQAEEVRARLDETDLSTIPTIRSAAT